MPESTARIVFGDCVLTYILSAEAWYAYALSSLEQADLLLLARSPSGVVHWEVRVIDRADLGQPLVEIRLTGDDVAAFVDVPDFFAALATGQPRDLVAVRAIADAIGAIDGTPRERPPLPPLDEGTARAIGEVS